MQLLYDTFSAFGAVLSAKVMTETDSTASRGFGFISFDCFESADAGIAEFFFFF
jgi:splicing factor 3B subunit 4